MLGVKRGSYQASSLTVAGQSLESRPSLHAASPSQSLPLLQPLPQALPPLQALTSCSPVSALSSAGAVFIATQAIMAYCQWVYKYVPVQ